MDTLDYVVEILEESLKRHGNIPLTIGHLLYIIRSAEHNMQEADHRSELEGGWE